MDSKRIKFNRFWRHKWMEMTEMNGFYCFSNVKIRRSALLLFGLELFWMTANRVSEWWVVRSFITAIGVWILGRDVTSIERKWRYTHTEANKELCESRIWWLRSRMEKWIWNNDNWIVNNNGCVNICIINKLSFRPA